MKGTIKNKMKNEIISKLKHLKHLEQKPNIGLLEKFSIENKRARVLFELVSSIE